MILAGDVGGTNTRLAFFELRDGALRRITEQIFPSRQFSSLDEIVIAFVEAKKIAVSHAGFGVAGPVRDGVCRATNLPWIVDASKLAARIGIASIALINDVEANAYGIATLVESDFTVLQQGAPRANGNAAVVSPGTGLGEAGLYWDGRSRRPFASEGGHASFAPDGELQGQLLAWLRPQFGHVSWERVLSGPGLLNIYKFLLDTGRGEQPPWLAEEMRRADPSAVISRAALEGRSELCKKALNLFVEIFGNEAGNYALKILATAGVYLGGGIAPKILPALRSPAFIEAFVSKGRMRPLLEAFPIRVILNDGTALRGAAYCASLQR